MRLFAGDDWAEDHHDVEVMNEQGRVLGRARLPEGVAGMGRLHELIGAHLGDDLDDAEVVIGIETDRGPWVVALVAAGYPVFAVNPLQAARFRERHGVSGAKSDAGDAHMLADMVRTDSHQLRPVAGDSADAAGIKVLARTHKTMAVALFGDRSGYQGLARSEIYRWFTDPAERRLYPEDDRPRQSRAQVANLRAAYGSMGPRSAAGDLVRALQQASPEFAVLWDRHEVAKRFEDHKVLIHPELGAIELDCQVLFTEDQSQALLVLTAPPHTEGYEKLQLLSVLGQQQFTEAGRG